MSENKIEGLTNEQIAERLRAIEHLGVNDWEVLDIRGDVFISRQLANRHRSWSMLPATALAVVTNDSMLAALKEVSLLINAGTLNRFAGEPWITRVQQAIDLAEGRATEQTK